MLTLARTNTFSRNVRRATALKGVLGALAAWKSRRALASLDAHMLNDIGLTSEDVERELKQPIWNVPSHWLR